MYPHFQETRLLNDCVAGNPRLMKAPLAFGTDFPSPLISGTHSVYGAICFPCYRSAP